jgi:hypothetical protein
VQNSLRGLKHSLEAESLGRGQPQTIFAGFGIFVQRLGGGNFLRDHADIDAGHVGLAVDLALAGDCYRWKHCRWGLTVSATDVVLNGMEYQHRISSVVICFMTV